MFPMNTFFQLAYVTRSLERGMELLQKQHGARDFIVFEPETEVQTAWGNGMMKVRAGLAWVDGLQLELIEPVSGKIEVYLPKLPDRVDELGFHHVAARTHDWEGLLAEIERTNTTIAYRGNVPGLEYVYLDLRSTLGHYLEYIWATPEMWKATGGPDT